MKTVMRSLGAMVLTSCLTWPMAANATGEETQPQPNVTAALPSDDGLFTPDAKRLFALGMIETGDNDWEIGGAGEISRYQLSPAVWRTYTKSRDYADPEVSLQVAWQHWNYLAHYFKQKTGREPDDFDMYVMWNTRFGYYAHKGFSPREISPVVRERAQRFVNLVNRKA